VQRRILVLLAHTELDLVSRVQAHAHLVLLANIATVQACLPLPIIIVTINVLMDSAALLALPWQLELVLARQTPIASRV
jgi:hypothetical protein